MKAGIKIYRGVSGKAHSVGATNTPDREIGNR